ncbi:MAG: hypothetical protein M3N14_04850 [Bacteroidota bacterium]|nr:hypothetical protein [Bacteroidota bacterium]
MKSSYVLIIFVAFLCTMLTGCALVGLLEIESVAAVGEVAEVATLSETAAFSEVAATGEAITISAEAETITEFKTIIRSDLNLDTYRLLKSHLTPPEFNIVEGVVKNEASVNSLLSKVRVARVGTSTPRLFIRTAPNEGVEFAEVTSNRTIRLIRSGKQYSLPGEIYTTKGQKVYLRDIQNYKLLAHINPHQIILVLDEVPVNGFFKVRIGTQTGLLAASSLVQVSHKIYPGPQHFNSYNYKSVTCSKCHGKGRFFCVHCSGSGKLLCPVCMGSSSLLCPLCSGSGKENCVKCKGYGSYICTVCQGRGRSGAGFCNTCSGKGKLFCEVCRGKGTTVCMLCHGKQTVLCNKCNGSTFISCEVCRGNGFFICDQCNGAGIMWLASK